MNETFQAQDVMAKPIPSWTAEELTDGGALAKIILGDAEYVLRITRSTKLILTK